MEKRKKVDPKDAEKEEFSTPSFIVPLEIDTHFQLFGKHMWEVEYTERCPRCDKKIDEFGYCACKGYSE